YMDASADFDMSIMASAYAPLTLRPKPGTEGNQPVSGLLAVLPSDMPENAKSEFNEGYNIVASGKDLEKAIPHFKKVTDAYPKYAPAYLLLGTAYVRTDKPDDAITPLQKAIELDPKSSDAYTVLGTVYVGQKKFPNAEQSLSKAVELAPTSFDAQYQLGRTYFAEQKWPEAQQHLAAALQSNPNSAEAHIQMGNTMLRLRNAEGALKEYQEGVRLDPKGPMAEPAKQMIGKIQTALAAQKK
ncbi:MAG TPA: tetratricopeptide repeat protein, partial [Terriglobales bacterium]|nr:tetratricopeptide repeat protein [Terriglobales bacterium]